MFIVNPEILGALARAEVMYRARYITSYISRYSKKSIEFSPKANFVLDICMEVVLALRIELSG